MLRQKCTMTLERKAAGGQISRMHSQTIDLHLHVPSVLSFNSETRRYSDTDDTDSSDLVTGRT